ncbi:MAG: 6-phosphogluconolactonase [Caulobacteraceae bacterium]
MIIEAFDDAHSLAETAAGAVVSALETGVRLNGTASLAATGGRSPGPVYDLMALAPLDWARVRVTLTDERWVDPSSPDSNARLVRERLLTHRAAAAAFHPLRNGESDPETAARHASALFHSWPPLDAVMLGMGEDGHVASLFPGSPALDQGLDPAAPACIAVPAGEGRPPPQPRLSLTIRGLTTAGLVVILTSGEAKRAVLERAMDGGDPHELPVRAVLQSARAVRILWTA